MVSSKEHLSGVVLARPLVDYCGRGRYLEVGFDVAMTGDDEDNLIAA